MRRPSLQSAALSGDPKTGVSSAGPVSHILVPGIDLQHAALASGAQTQGLLTASTADALTRCQPGARVAASPHRDPSGIEVHAEQKQHAASNNRERTTTSFPGIAVQWTVGDGRPV